MNNPQRVTESLLEHARVHQAWFASRTGEGRSPTLAAAEDKAYERLTVLANDQTITQQEWREGDLQFQRFQ